MRFRPAALAAALLAASLSLPALAQTRSGIDPSGQDPAVRIQDDLFRAVNGRWLTHTEIPADKSRYGSFIMLRDQSDREVRAIVEGLAGKAQPKGSAAEKVAHFYQSYVDLDAIDRLGLTPLRPAMARIQALKSPAQLARWLGEHAPHGGLPMGLAIEPDFKEPGLYRAYVTQGGLGVPDRDYYLKTDNERYAKAVAAYTQYLETLARLAGLPQPAQAAADTLQLERQLAAAHWDKVDNRDPDKTYNPYAPADLGKLAAGFDWKGFLQAAQLGRTDKIVMSQPSSLAATAKLLAEAPLAQWKTYLTLHLLDAHADTLPKAFREARFAYRGQALTGAKAEKPRWQQGIDSVNAALGEALGQLYVAEHFPPEAKARMLKLVNNLLASFGDSIDGLSWMSPETQLKAKKKLSTYRVKIGYPEKWRDYRKLEVRAGQALLNGARAQRFAWDRVVARVGQPVDKDEWELTPQTVNAYYNPFGNEIVFPAAILRPPFFDMQADDAVNYGGIGGVIGHEISHGFDDEGSKFDHDGALRNWWTEADRKAFTQLADRLVAQYNAYEPIPGQHVNGKLTLGENIADLSGLQIAYKAYRKSLGGQAAPVLDGLTGEQRFFHGWSQVWRDKSREARLLQQLTTDPHSPAEFRANGAAVNHDGFHSAFGTKEGDKMFKKPEERIRIW